MRIGPLLLASALTPCLCAACSGADAGDATSTTGLTGLAPTANSTMAGSQVAALPVSAKSCSQTDVQHAVDAASSGQTVLVPSGSCSWTAPVTVQGKALTLQGQTVCDGTPGVQVTRCTDKTIITLSTPGNAGSLRLEGSASNFVAVTGFTFVAGAASSPNWNGVLGIGGTHANLSFRFHHNHLLSNTGYAFLAISDTYGLVDHVLWEDTGTSGMAPALVCGGDYGSRGYLDWHDATQFGSDQAIYVEDSRYNSQNTGSEGFFDCYHGAKIVMRHSTLNNHRMGGWHGTDSGGYRSAILGEIYDNTITNSLGVVRSVITVRGGTILFFNNVVGGTTPWGGGAVLEYFRMGETSDVGQWGTAGPGLNWTPEAATGGHLATINTLNAADFVASHLYAAGATVGPRMNNPGGWNFQNAGTCSSSGAYPSLWNQKLGQTTTDSHGCVWMNVGGNTGASPPGAGFCAANPDTQCSLDSTCSALKSGDRCSRYFDNDGGTYPYRDQPGRVHNQALAPAYAWKNSGSDLPNPVIGAAFDSLPGGTSIVVEGRDYYNNTAMPGYTPYTYPHPLQSR